MSLFLAAPASAETKPVKIGDMCAYTAFASECAYYRKGWEQAVREINAKGGLLGHPVEVISRDHGDTPQQGVLVATDLVEREKVDVLAGTVLANVTNAIANYTGNKKFPLVTLWNTLPASDGKQNDDMFSIMSTESQSMAAADFAATLKAKKWATIAPNFAYGHTSVELFKNRLKKLRPDVEFVTERWPTVNKIDADNEVAALEQAEPDAIFSTLFASDLSAFVRAGNRRNLFDHKIVLGQEMGERIYTRVIGKELKGAWYAAGDPSPYAKDPQSTFFADYRKQFGDDPQMYTYAGYLLYKFIFAAVEKAGSTAPDKISKALEEVEIPTPMGKISMNPQNHRSNFGVWIGRLQPTKDGADLVDWEYKDAGPYLGSAVAGK
ncbi:MAG: ABC transporter substrate-binding protein [Alphaproteobacteria bacterium]|nr:ABC transporter substrate-binding protein [Alphaproteobacteria bacterium]